MNELIEQLESCLKTIKRALKLEKRHLKTKGVKKFHIQLILDVEQIGARIDELRKMN